MLAHVDACGACSARLAELEGATRATLHALQLGGRETPVGYSPPSRRDEAVPGYEILERIGEGGMGVVYKARHRRLGRLVALKRLRSYAPSPEILRRFLREAETFAALQHPNIVQIHEVGEHDGRPFLALEFVAGGSLAPFAWGRPAAPKEAATLVADLADAVHHAHCRGVVHRDLKPANILLQVPDDRPRPIDSLEGVAPKITDFGIAKWIEGSAESGVEDWSTQTGLLLGTPAYMAPEQLSGGSVGPLVDVYALGVIFYQLLTGGHPLGLSGSESFHQAMMADREPEPPSRVRPDLPRDLGVVCLKCLRKDPSQRYASAAELAADLRRFLAGRPILARPAPLWEVAWKGAKRRPAVAAALVVAQGALVVMAFGAAWYNGRLRDALRSTQAAERQAEANARTALDAHSQLVEQVRTALRDAPATRNLRRGLLETAVAGLRNVTTADATAPRLSRASAHQLLGEVHWELGRAGEAIAEMDRCRAVATALLAVDPALADARDQLALACRRLGIFHLRGDRPDLARSLFREALDVAEAWLKDSPDDPRAELAVIEGLEHLGHAAHWVGDFAGARPLLERMLAMTEVRIAARPDDPRSEPLLGKALDLLGGVDESLGDLRSARDKYRRALDLELAAEVRREDRDRAAGVDRTPEGDSAFRNIIVSLNNLALIDLQLGDLPKALAGLDAGLERARRWAARDPEDVQRKLDLVEALGNRGVVEMRNLRFAAAVPFLEEDWNLLEGLRAAGKLAGLPIYGLERRDEIADNLAICRLADRAAKDEAVAWSAPERIAPRVADARMALLLAEGRKAAAVATAERLAAYHPEGAIGWLVKARVCSQRVESFEAETAAGLLDASVQALGRVYDLSVAPPRRRELETDERLAAARRSPAFAAVLARAPADKDAPGP
nr:serine/threonine-protein kinase [Paludisphaera mucosa]